MDLLQLRYFLDVAETQHITQSAHRLHIAQPSLSQAIGRLEKELGVSLFCRQGRNIRLTDCGVLMRDQVAPILAKLDSLPARLQELQDAETATVRLHVEAASILVTESIVAYQKEHPAVRFQFVTAEDSDTCDLEIGPGTGSLRKSDRADNAVFTEEILLAVPLKDALAHSKGIDLRDFSHRKFISLMNSREFRMSCDRFCAKAGFIPRTTFESDNPYSVRNMIAANMGVGFWPAHTWGPMEENEVRLLPILSPVCSRSIHITCGKARRENETISRFYRFICRFFAEKMPE